MAAHLSYVRQYLCPLMRVSVVNVQEHFAGIAVAVMAPPLTTEHVAVSAPG